MPLHRYLRCLGTPTLIGPNGEPIRFKTRKHFALLIYLARSPKRSRTRNHLMGLLWADKPSRLLLRHVTQRLVESPMFVLTTSRDTDVLTEVDIDGVVPGTIQILLGC